MKPIMYYSYEITFDRVSGRPDHKPGIIQYRQKRILLFCSAKAGS